MCWASVKWNLNSKTFKDHRNPDKCEWKSLLVLCCVLFSFRALRYYTFQHNFRNGRAGWKRLSPELASFSLLCPFPCSLTPQPPFLYVRDWPPILCFHLYWTVTMALAGQRSAGDTASVKCHIHESTYPQDSGFAWATNPTILRKKKISYIYIPLFNCHEDNWQTFANGTVSRCINQEQNWCLAQ